MLLKHTFLGNINSVLHHQQQRYVEVVTLEKTAFYTVYFCHLDNLTSHLYIVVMETLLNEVINFLRMLLTCSSRSVFFLNTKWFMFLKNTNTSFRFDIIEEKLIRRFLRNVDESLLLPTIRFFFVSWKLHHGIFPTFPLFFLFSFMTRSYERESWRLT
jgi:hypothetical protein